MTTAFTAMPMKMTTSAIRFLGGCDMAESYPTIGALSINTDQPIWIFQGVEN
jgi:hypothetical protein